MRNLLEFLLDVGKLKRVKRRGWVLRGVKNPESVAEHSFRTAMMAWVLGYGRPVNQEKLLKMALIHDLVEVISGDPTPYDDLILKNPSKKKEILKKWPRRTIAEAKKLAEIKKEKEGKAMEILTSVLPEGLKKEFKDLWDEFENSSTREALFLHQIEKIENTIQAIEYAQEYPDFPMEPWWLHLLELVDDRKLLELVSEMESYFLETKKFSNGKNKNKKVNSSKKSLLVSGNSQ